MSFLTLEFAIVFHKVLNIDFPLILISLNVVERSLNDLSNRWCKRENVVPDVLKEWKTKIHFFKLLILVFHLTLVTHVFTP